MIWRTPYVVIALCALDSSAAESVNWQPKMLPLPTRWSKEVTPTNAHLEYPRPQMVRSEWLNLNGLWDYALTSQHASEPRHWQGKLLVPFPVESDLSCVALRINERQRLWYRRTFTIPAGWYGRHILLHFGAVDWEAAVHVNGEEIGAHRGGYDSFTFDITHALKSDGDQELVVVVADPTNSGLQARGKQVNISHDTWYSAASGIWQTVWLEPVGSDSIESIRLVPDIDKGLLNVTLQTSGEDTSPSVQAVVFDGGKEVSQTTGTPGHGFDLSIPNPKLWSTDSPFLYDLKLTLMKKGREVDEVVSYFGLRKISISKDKDGVLQMHLNNKRVFQLGVLDQGYWPDGIYTAPTDAALRHDIELMKRLGFDVCRKHMKIEPERWYYWCDKLGLLVWQDMPDGNVGEPRRDVSRSEEAARQFEVELRAMVEGRFNHPSVVMWILFNQGWGQYDTDRITQMVKDLDPTRLVMSASGWFDRGGGDVVSLHGYSRPPQPTLDGKRACVVGEFGGLGLNMEKHVWPGVKTWSQRTMRNTNELTAGFVRLLEAVELFKRKGLVGAIYTQLTDVESEVNGLVTYDREITKVDEATVTVAVRKVREFEEGGAVSEVAVDSVSEHTRLSQETFSIEFADDEARHEADDSAIEGSHRRASPREFGLALALLFMSSALGLLAAKGGLSTKPRVNG